MKSQAATLGAVLMTFLVVRATGTGVPAGNGPAPQRQAALRDASREEAGPSGPWLASCAYWAPLRRAESVGAEPQTNPAASAPNLAQQSRDCAGAANVWGVPRTTSPKITTIIATVPDPIHSDFSLQFDRAMDALIDAGEDRGYLTSYYWLPWERQMQKLAESLGSSAPDSTGLEEHEPGLIIFRHSVFSKGDSSGKGDQGPSNPPPSLYLFLVGETPTSGIDGEQMQKALEYQRVLSQQGASVVRSLKAADELDIVGPSFSGSASSLRLAIDTELKRGTSVHSVRARGVTSTPWAAQQLNQNAQGCRTPGNATLSEGTIEYCSFGNDTVFDQHTLATRLRQSGVPGDRLAILIEDGTTLGQAALVDLRTHQLQPIYIRFPREISMLRNAQTEQESRTKSSEQSADAPPSPYLHLSLRDANTYDSVPHLSHDITPLSQEAQLMTIAHELERCHADYVVISASDVLDQIFLARFLHRALPDARLVFDGGDLLFEREVDDVPYIGSLTLGPYPLPWLSNTLSTDYGGRPFSDWATEAYYNAASYTFSSDPGSLPLADYGDPFARERTSTHPPLWATVIGSNGYYPLGVLNASASDDPSILPSREREQGSQPNSLRLPKAWLPFHPSHAWQLLCLLLIGLCCAHTVSLQVSDFWSPLTRDLAVHQNDQPWRRSMCIHIGAAMLFCMSFVVAWPLFASLALTEPDIFDWLAAVATPLAGLAVAVTTARKTWRYRRMKNPAGDMRFYNQFNLLALLTAIALPIVWLMLCSGSRSSHAGLFFAYRCLHPESGVSPLLPVLWLLFSWYIWSLFQTLRLRFSASGRPYLPGRVKSTTPYPLYVADEDLADCRTHRSGCLYRNITCLLITREALRRFLQAKTSAPIPAAQPPGALVPRETAAARFLDLGLSIFYFAVFVAVLLLPCTQSVDRILWPVHHLPTPYEFLIKALFFPLLVIALTGWLRMMFVWASLQRSLLQRLENMPIRCAFDRLQGAGWIAMFRESGLREQWRDMARSSESMRQFLNQPTLDPQLKDALATPARKLEQDVRALLCHVAEEPQPDPAVVEEAIGALPGERTGAERADIPCTPCIADLALTHAIEKDYARFAEVLLEKLLLPWWTTQRTGLVESQPSSAAPETAAPAKAKAPRSDVDTPAAIMAAEEFVAIRYVSLIRAVLVNLRYLMIFVSAAFVLAIVSWNSYPFEPHQLVNWLFTLLLVALGLGIIGVFAQMHRDPILSRITHTTPNELGLDFWFRIASFGAVPVLTWFAYNFPEVGGTLFRVLRPGMDLMK